MGDQRSSLRRRAFLWSVPAATSVLAGCSFLDPNGAGPDEGDSDSDDKAIDESIEEVTLSRSDGTVRADTLDDEVTSGDDFSTVLQEVIDSMEAGGTITVEADTYDWSRQVTWSDNVHLTGSGDVTLAATSSLDGAFIDCFDVTEGAHFENITFDATDHEPDNDVVGDVISRRRSNTRQKTNMLVENCTFVDVNYQCVNADNWYESEISNCRVDGCQYVPFRLHSTEEVVCKDNVIDVRGYEQYQAIFIDGRETVISGNRILIDSGIAVGISPDGDFPQRDLEIADNTIEGDDAIESYGVVFGSENASEVEIEDNSFQNLYYGVSGWGEESTISDNDFEGCEHGIAGDRNSNNSRISNNRFENCRVAILVSGSQDNTFEGNTVHESEYGYFEEDNADFNVVTENVFADISNHGIRLNGDNSQESDNIINDWSTERKSPSLDVRGRTGK